MPNTTPWLEELEGDRLRGATELAGLAANSLNASLSELSPSPKSGFLATLIDLADSIRRSQPAMAPLFHLANTALLAAETAEADPDLIVKVQTALRGFIRVQRTIGAQAIQRILPLLRPGSRILTHSASSLVETAIRHADRRQRGGVKDIRVICTESRPAGEGIGLARRLSRAGIFTTLVTDAAAGEALSEADLFLTGADSVTQEGVIHKVGTSLIAEMAKKKKTPCFALATSQKLLPERFLSPSWRALREADEILRTSSRHLMVQNPTFDRTEWSRLTAVVTEEGPISRGEVSRHLRALRIAKSWT